MVRTRLGIEVHIHEKHTDEEEINFNDDFAEEQELDTANEDGNVPSL